MNYLFIHQNFPAQFGPLASHLAAEPGNRVAAIGSQSARPLPGVSLHRYSVVPPDHRTVHPFARRFDFECRRAEQIVYMSTSLRASGFTPDVVAVHCGWGESLPLRSLYPSARIATYCEYFYHADGFDVAFDPEWERLSLDMQVSLRARNAATLLALADTDVAWSPTEWQRSTFPAFARPVIDVCHEGVDLDAVRPDPSVSYTLPNGVTLRAGDEVVTFVARDLEPMRGYHVFMRALPELLAARPLARIVIVGGDGLSYGAAPPAGRTWKDVFLDEVRDRLDLSRVHFLGRISRDDFVKVLQVSACHVYLTYPFVLSWSMLEAMAAGCIVIGSATGPVEEVIDGSNGLLVDFFGASGLARLVGRVLARPAFYADLRERARHTVVARFDRRRSIAEASSFLTAGLV